MNNDDEFLLVQSLEDENQLIMLNKNYLELKSTYKNINIGKKIIIGDQETNILKAVKVIWKSRHIKDLMNYFHEQYEEKTKLHILNYEEEVVKEAQLIQFRRKMVNHKSKQNSNLIRHHVSEMSTQTENLESKCTETDDSSINEIEIESPIDIFIRTTKSNTKELKLIKESLDSLRTSISIIKTDFEAFKKSVKHTLKKMELWKSNLQLSTNQKIKHKSTDKPSIKSTDKPSINKTQSSGLQITYSNETIVNTKNIINHQNINNKTEKILNGVASKENQKEEKDTISKKMIAYKQIEKRKTCENLLNSDADASLTSRLTPYKRKKVENKVEDENIIERESAIEIQNNKLENKSIIKTPEKLIDPTADIEEIRSYFYNQSIQKSQESNPNLDLDVEKQVKQENINRYETKVRDLGEVTVYLTKAKNNSNKSCDSQLLENSTLYPGDLEKNQTPEVIDIID